MYDHKNQYRCTIIRGKSQKDMDDLLSAYAKVLDEICPCREEDFETAFNNAFQQYIPASERIKKTLDNHRTEISGKLFGMYYKAGDGFVYTSERTLKYLEDNDQPAFFKDLCYKMQFPNGMDKPQTIIQRMENGICIRPNAFVLRLLQLAETTNITLTVSDIGYYVLNSLDVLSGKAAPLEVLECIIDDKRKGIVRKIKAFDADGKLKASSFTMQHIREQLNYLELANLIRIVRSDSSSHIVKLNPKESRTIDLFASNYNKKPDFDVYSYDFSTIEGRRAFQLDWDEYFAKLSAKASEFETSAEALIDDAEEKKEFINKAKTYDDKTILGDEGENLVYHYEVSRVAAYNRRLTNKVIPFGKTKGVGYDIQSIMATNDDEGEFCKYIEVKSTKRLTSPDPGDPLWIDTLNITRNEWIAALQHTRYFSIYRVYFTRDGIKLFILNNVSAKKDEGTITVTPMTYRLDFSNVSVDEVDALDNLKIN